MPTEICQTLENESLNEPVRHVEGVKKVTGEPKVDNTRLIAKKSELEQRNRHIESVKS
jgi:hypothetical protein